MISRLVAPIALLVTISLVGCPAKYREDLDYEYEVAQEWSLDDIAFGKILQFDSVFWEPDDTVSLRKMIVEENVAAGRDVLEIGTGTGLLAIICLQSDAKSVIATDINPAAVANAEYNAAVLIAEEDLDVRLVSRESPGAFAVIRPDEQFDLIVSNPPWENGVVTKPADYAYYDSGFALMDSLLDGLPKHLKPAGRCLLSYGHVPAVRRLQAACQERGLDFKIHDDRDIDTLDDNFMPGMLLEIRLPLDATQD